MKLDGKEQEAAHEHAPTYRQQNGYQREEGEGEEDEDKGGQIHSNRKRLDWGSRHTMEYRDLIVPRQTP